MPRRVGAGSAVRREDARHLCLLEGVERYSLQYQAGDPRRLTSSGAAGTAVIERNSAGLLLGHPDHPPGRPLPDSRGCAVGSDLDDAAQRGLLELIEHDALASWWAQEGDFRWLDASYADPAVDAIAGWLEQEQRQIRFLYSRDTTGASVVLAVCTDRDGMRPAVGSAARPRLQDAIRHACLESALLSYNLEALDKSEGADARLRPTDRKTLAMYRGQLPMPGSAATATIDWEQAAAQLESFRVNSNTSMRFSDFAASLPYDVAVFDLTRPEISIPCARVVAITKR